MWKRKKSLQNRNQTRLEDREKGRSVCIFLLLVAVFSCCLLSRSVKTLALSLSMFLLLLFGGRRDKTKLQDWRTVSRPSTVQRYGCFRGAPLDQKFVKRSLTSRNRFHYSLGCLWGFSRSCPAFIIISLDRLSVRQSVATFFIPVWTVEWTWSRHCHHASPSRMASPTSWLMSLEEARKPSTTCTCC